MARENQGLQIALIISVLIICLLGVTTYIFVSKSEMAESREKSMQSDLQQEKQGHSQAVDDVQRLMGFVGHPPESKMEDVEAIFDEDMKMFASSWPEEERNYRTLPSFMIGVITDRSSQLTDASNTEKELREETEQVRKEESARVEKVERKLQPTSRVNKGSSMRIVPFSSKPPPSWPIPWKKRMRKSVELQIRRSKM